MCSRANGVGYKPSKFTYVLETPDAYILYNALQGADSIRKVPKSYADFVNRYLMQPYADYLSEPLLDKLIDYGYVVPEQEDETILLHDLYSRNAYDSTLNLAILPTEQCNFRCKYCYESFGRTKMDEDTVSALIKAVRKNIHKYSGLRVSWFGGEPTVETDIIIKLSQAFQAICKKAKRTYWANITTNGFLLNQQTFERLYECNIYQYQVTIDGVEATHDLQRVLVGGQGSFNTIIQNLIAIKKHERYRHWFITIRTNFSKDIYETMDAYMEYFTDLFGDDERFSFLIRPAGDWGGERVKQYSDHMLCEDGLSAVFQKMLNSSRTLIIMRLLSFLIPAGSLCRAAIENSLLLVRRGGLR